jgi:signal transduction histidine kinase
MNKGTNMLSLLKVVLSAALFVFAVYFENAQQQRLLLLILIFAGFLTGGFLRFFLNRERLVFYLTFYWDLLMIFLMEQNSRLLINYFFHSLYILVLLEGALSLNMKKGTCFGSVAVLVSMIKYGYLIYYKFNLASVSQMAFFLLVNVLILIIAGFAQHNREERLKKDLLYKELLDTHKKLKQSTDEVNRLSVVSERNRIAREIHDALGHNMTALIMQLQMTEHLLGEDEKRAEELLKCASDTARNSLTGIREVVETLRGEEKVGFTFSAIRDLIRDFSEKTGVSIQLELESGSGAQRSGNTPESYQTAAAMALYRIVQEALTNAVRHGSATEILVRIESLEKEIRFCIRDNGTGASEITEGFGLKGMRERTEAFGGTIEILADQGFTLSGNLYLEGGNDKNTAG